MFQIPDIQLDECPVSFITADSRELVNLDGRMRRVKDAGGAVFLGPNSGEWPAWWADVVACLEVQRVMEHNARSRQEIEDLRSETDGK